MRGSTGSGLGPQTPVEQHIGGSKIWSFVVICSDLLQGDSPCATETEYIRTNIYRIPLTDTYVKAYILYC